MSEEKHQRLVKAIKKNEPVYLSENGYALCEEDYLNFEEWVDSVGKPTGSSVEKFTRYAPLSSGIEEIPQMKGTLEALDKLTIRANYPKE